MAGGAWRTLQAVRETRCPLQEISAGLLLHVTSPASEPAKNEFLRQAGAHSLRGTDGEIAKHQPGAAIGSGVIQVGESRGCQIPANARVIRLPSPVVASGNKRAEQCMADSRTGGARSLIEVAR